MLDFDDFQDDATLFILAVLWCMPWASANNIASVGRFSPAYVRKQLKLLQDEAFIFGAPIGRAFGRVQRYVLLPSGVELVRAQFDDPPVYPHSDRDLRTHTIDIEFLEVLYAVAPTFWANIDDENFNPEKPVDIRTAAGERMDAEDLRDMKLKSLLWCRGETIQVLGRYRSAYRKDEIIVPMMQYGTHHRPIPYGKPLFTGLRFEADISESTDPWEDPIEIAYPVTMVAVVPDEFSAFLVDQSGSHLATVSFDTNGKRVSPMRVRTQIGRYVPPYVNSRDADVGGILSESLDDIREGRFVLGELDMKVVRMVYRWLAVEHQDVVKNLGATNGTRIRQVADGLIDRGWIGESNDIYHLGEVGTGALAILDRIPLEQASNRTSFLRNVDGSMSVRKLGRASRVARIGLLLQRAGNSTALGRRLDMSKLGRNHLYMDEHFPDAYIGVPQQGDLQWVPLEYMDTENIVESARRRLLVHLSSYNRGKPWTEGDPPTVYIVAGNPEIEEAVLAAGSALPMSVILFEALATQCGSGRDPAWKRNVPVARPSRSSGTGGQPQPPDRQSAATTRAQPKPPAERPSPPAAQRQPGRTSNSSPGPLPDARDRQQVGPEPQHKRSIRQKLHKLIIGEPKRSR